MKKLKNQKKADEKFRLENEKKLEEQRLQKEEEQRKI